MEYSGGGVFDVEFIRVAAPAAEELNFVVRVPCCGSFRGSASTKAVAGVQSRVQARSLEGSAHTFEESVVMQRLPVDAFK